MKTGYSNRCRPRPGLTVLLLLVMSLAACSPDRPPTGDLAQGQEPYLRWCASCHGFNGEGKPPTFPPIAGSEWLDLSDQALALIVLYGLRGEIQVKGETYRGYMPPMQHLSDQDIADIIVFMRSAWTEDEASIDADGVERLRTIFPGRRPPLEGLDGLLEAVEFVEAQ